MRKHLSSLNLWSLCLIPILIGLCFLWFGRDLRPIHHDESLHALYGLYYYFDPSTAYYKYDPMLHGPLLYHLMPWVFHFFDETLNSIRLLPAIFFTLIPVGITILFKEKLGPKFLIPSALLLTSPYFIYWGGFLRHDSLVLFLMMLAGFSFYSSFKKFGSILFLSSIALQFCTKENSFIHLLFLFGFLLFDYLISKKSTLLNTILENKLIIKIIAILLSILLYIYYYSGGFNYSEGILDGLYRKSLAYWSNQHSVERISGPFLTQFFVLLWYDLPLLLLMIFSVFKIHWKEKLPIRLLPFITLFIAGIFHLAYGSEIPKTSLWSTFLKLKIGIDFYGFIFLIVTSVSGTWLLIKKNFRSLAFLYYWTFASFFTYSFLGEKVPWLSLYTLVSGVIFVSIYFKDLKTKILSPALLTIFLFNGFQSYKLIFTNTGSKTEFISQVHTTPAYQKLSTDFQKILDSNSGFKILALRDNTWPLSWFLYKREGYFYHHEGRELSEFDIILDKWPSNLKIEGYKKKRIALRHWWLPDWTQVSWKKALSYSLFHTPWNAPGEQYILVYYREGLPNF